MDETFICDICREEKIIGEEFIQCTRCNAKQCTVDCAIQKREGTELSLHCGLCGLWLCSGQMDYESDEQKEKYK